MCFWRAWNNNCESESGSPQITNKNPVSCAVLRFSVLLHSPLCSFDRFLERLVSFIIVLRSSSALPLNSLFLGRFIPFYFNSVFQGWKIDFEISSLALAFLLFFLCSSFLLFFWISYKRKIAFKVYFIFSLSLLSNFLFYAFLKVFWAWTCSEQLGKTRSLKVSRNATSQTLRQV